MVSCSVGGRGRRALVGPVGLLEVPERHCKKPRPGSSSQAEFESGLAHYDARLARARKEKHVAQQEAWEETMEACMAIECDARAAEKMAKTEAKKQQREEAEWQASIRSEEVLNRAADAEARRAAKAAEKAAVREERTRAAEEARVDMAFDEVVKNLPPSDVCRHDNDWGCFPLRVVAYVIGEGKIQIRRPPHHSSLFEGPTEQKDLARVQSSSQIRRPPSMCSLVEGTNEQLGLVPHTTRRGAAMGLRRG
jgi:hypothetical protein